jgi:hypothetical protein
MNMLEETLRTWDLGGIGELPKFHVDFRIRVLQKVERKPYTPNSSRFYSLLFISIFWGTHHYDLCPVVSILSSWDCTIAWYLNPITGS